MRLRLQRRGCANTGGRGSQAGAAVKGCRGLLCSGQTQDIGGPHIQMDRSAQEGLTPTPQGQCQGDTHF